ncbi:hypothetical protein NM688_g9178 [Phlebia brevispora]|uniref:Uncharacterized protein n=1 Tax=Phlebia brevispora TaxID=194682 RepID=A0ACC1RIN7_9APHY|nr:hypothetical protein NM688_g9178 [Phlebia brevispora]
MVSSASAQIEATGGDRFKTHLPGQTSPVPDYAKVQAMLIGIVAAFDLFIIMLGPENHGSHFEMHKTAFEEIDSVGNEGLGGTERHGESSFSPTKIVFDDTITEEKHTIEEV